LATKSDKNFSPEIRNRKASYEYSFLEKYIAGIVLTGPEVKSIREGKINMTDAFCTFEHDELYVRELNISPYKEGTYNNLPEKRPRKLLLSRQELRKISGKLKEKGITLIPIRLFFTDRGFIKLEIALAKGKKDYDKRDSIKERDISREVRREID
jgi:SsrA-binding protein